jgi:hypothetical protein
LITQSTEYIETSNSQKIKYEEFNDLFTEGDILRILSYISRLQSEVRNAQNQKIKVEIGLAHLIGFEKSSTISELLATIDSIPKIGDKKKTKIVTNNSINEEKPQPLIPQFEKEKTESIQKKSNLNDKEVLYQNIEPKKELIEIDLNLVTNLEELKIKWESFKEKITKKRFTLGPLLEHSIPASLSNNNLYIDVNHKDDVNILSESSDFLSNYLFELYKIKVKFIFNYNEENFSSLSQKSKFSDETEEDEQTNHPLISSIKADLGGKEII